MEGYPPGAIWPAEDFDGMQCREVYARYGLAMSQAQVLEHGMVNTLLVFSLMPFMSDYPSHDTWVKAFDRFYNVELAKTFGNMLKAIAAVPGFPTSLLDRLRSAKTDRDHLAHRFFREHDTDFMTREGRTLMIAECEKLITRFGELDRAIEAFAATQRRKFGYTAERVEQMVEEMIATARAAEGRAESNPIAS